MFLNMEISSGKNSDNPLGRKPIVGASLLAKMFVKIRQQAGSHKQINF
jgi:hypothetical protein